MIVERIGGVHDDAFVADLANRLRPHGVLVQPVKLTKSKGDRACIAASRMERGLIYFPVDKLWRTVLETELLAFPKGGAHDDIEYCVSIAASAGFAMLWLLASEKLWAISGLDGGRVLDGIPATPAICPVHGDVREA
jgi:hypothetical protein